MISKYGIVGVCGRKCVIVDENNNVVSSSIFNNVTQAKSFLNNKYFKPVIQRVSLNEIIRYYKGI